MKTAPSILIIEDEPSIADALVYALETEGFAVRHAKTLAAGSLAFSESEYDLLILDVGLPDGNGFEFCKELRRRHETPVLFLTARSSEIDRIVGLEIGGDDYVTKPFSPREITARVKVILKRTKSACGAGQELSTGRRTESPFRVDDQRMRISFRGEPLELSRYEFGLLRWLVLNPGRVYSRAQLMELVWEDPEMSLDRTVDAHIKMLRQKLRDLAPDEEWIVTHRGIGYSLKEIEE